MVAAGMPDGQELPPEMQSVPLRVLEVSSGRACPPPLHSTLHSTWFGAVPRPIRRAGRMAAGVGVQLMIGRVLRRHGAALAAK